MVYAFRDTLRVLRGWPGFAAAVLVALGAAGFNGLMVALMMLEVDLPGAFGRMTHFQGSTHRVHDLTFGFLFVPAVLGLLAQLRRPVANVSSMLMALIPAAGLAATLVLTLVVAGDTRVLQPPWMSVGAAALIAVSLHPSGRDLVRSFRVSRVDLAMLGLVSVAAGPLFVYASSNIRLQGSVPDDHAAAGHYGFMAAFALTVVAVAALASLRADGWRPTAWVAGLLPALLGVTSLVYPDVRSGLDPLWAVAAISWGAGFVATAEYRHMTSKPADRGSDPDPDGASTRGMPLGVKVPAVAVGVLVLLFAVLQMVGVDGGHGPRLHDGDTPSRGEVEPPSGGGDRRDPQHLEGFLDGVDGLTPEELEEFFEDLHR